MYRSLWIVYPHNAVTPAWLQCVRGLTIVITSLKAQPFPKSVTEAKKKEKNPTDAENLSVILSRDRLSPSKEIYVHSHGLKIHFLTFFFTVVSC